MMKTDEAWRDHANGYLERSSLEMRRSLMVVVGIGGRGGRGGLGNWERVDAMLRPSST